MLGGILESISPEQQATWGPGSGGILASTSPVQQAMLGGILESTNPVQQEIGEVSATSEDKEEIWFVRVGRESPEQGRDFPGCQTKPIEEGDKK
jgi:hypothetical protein